ncbi:hypothetical protein ACFLSK_04030 [Chloroflexota bacterium]
MTRTSMRECTEAVRWRYLWSSKMDKGKILDESTKVTGYHCYKRLRPFLPELVKVIRRHGESTMSDEFKARLCKMSPSAIDQVLRPWWFGGRRPFSTTKPTSLLKSTIPIRTFADR